MAWLKDVSTYQFLLESERPKYFFGINEYLASAADVFEFDGVIDDFTSALEVNELKVVRSSELPEGALVVVGVSSNYLVSVMKMLDQMQSVDYFHYIQLVASCDLELEQIKQISDSKSDFQLNHDKYLGVRAMLDDDVSRDTWDRLIEFRVNGDVSAMDAFTYRPHEQYFEKFLNCTESEVFVDGGGFDGDTALRFADFCPSYSEVYVFEPCKETFELALANTSNLKNCHCFNKGLYSSDTTLSFKADQGSSNSIASEGDVVIDVVALDEVEEIKEIKPTLIKLDIEGAELEALKGMRETIALHEPKLAIAVYHNARDFWEIPEYILSLKGDYKLYVRHYTEGWAETIMFFVPK